MSRPEFDYSLDFKTTDFRRHPELYRIGKGEQGVLLVKPYKGEPGSTPITSGKSSGTRRGTKTTYGGNRTCVTPTTTAWSCIGIDHQKRGPAHQRVNWQCSLGDST